MPNPYTGETANLYDLLTAPNVAIVAHLAKNDLSAQVGPLNLALMQEADFPGYAPIPMDPYTFIDPTDDLYGEAKSRPLRFASDNTLTTPQALYALYITQQVGNDPPTLVNHFPFDQAVLVEAPNQNVGYEATIASAANAA